MNTSPAIDPSRNATVSASAGSGKTWLLVMRILRLLLAGNILALTFTRKAATEMSMRLTDRLFEMATIDDDRLDGLLLQAGAAADEHSRRRARALYEEPIKRDVAF